MKKMQSFAHAICTPVATTLFVLCAISIVLPGFFAFPGMWSITLFSSVIAVFLWCLWQLRTIPPSVGIGGVALLVMWGISLAQGTKELLVVFFACFVIIGAFFLSRRYV